MARKIREPELRQAHLSQQQMAAAIPKIDRRIAELDAFDVKSINDRRDPRINALSAKLEAFLASTFEVGTVEYDQFRRRVTELDRAPHIIGGIPIHEVREGIALGLATSKSQLETIRAIFVESLEDNRETTTAETPADDGSLYGLHPAVTKKCLPLYQAEMYAEAVERSFKVVRDRLRELTGFETGADAFGRGRLYIRGAAAPHVDF